MKHEIFIGVDGGATKTVVRVEDALGRLLGLEVGGPANIRLSVPQAWKSIYTALEKIFADQHISPKTHTLHAGMGLAGSEIADAYKAFLETPHYFTSLQVSSDAHTACLGAHGGEDGAIVAIGTGIVGYAIHHDSVSKISGWGFPHDDLGSGAWLGLEAMKLTLQWLDGRSEGSTLARAIYQHFKVNKELLITWANQANSTAFAELAPIIIQQSLTNDLTAKALLQRAAYYVELIINALQAKHKLPLVLLGGLANVIEPYLSSHLQNELQPCKNSPEVGAILLIRQSHADTKLKTQCSY